MEQVNATLPEDWPAILAAVAVVATLAIAGAIVIGSILRRVLVSWLGAATPRERAIVDGVVRLGRGIALLVIGAVLIFPALELSGVAVPAGFQSAELGQWLADTGVRIAVIFVMAALIVRLAAVVTVRAEEDIAAGTGLDALERRKRAQTLGRLVRRVVSVLIWSMAFLIVLRELEVDIAPVLTGAGIAGLAVGFGAQTLVRDVLSGFFLIAENQVRVGDVAQVNGQGGLVEQINLRTIVLRDLHGTVHIFPNGEIKTLANLTKDFSYYVIDMPVDYADDTDRVVDAVRAAADELVRDPAFGSNILEPLEVLGVDAFDASQVTVKIRIKTVPLKQWEVGRELRRRIKRMLDARGIQIPFPQLTLHAPGIEATNRAGAPLS